METDAGVGSEAEQRALPAPRMSGQHAYQDNHEEAVCRTLESWGRFWSLLCQAATESLSECFYSIEMSKNF